MAKINMIKQSEIISEIAMCINDESGDASYNTIENFLKGWELSDLAKKYVGESGYIEIPIEHGEALETELSSERVELLNSINIRARTLMLRGWRAVEAELDYGYSPAEQKYMDLHTHYGEVVRLNKEFFAIKGNKVVVVDERYKNLRTAQKALKKLGRDSISMIETARDTGADGESLFCREAYLGTASNVLEVAARFLDQLSQEVSSTIPVTTGRLVLSALPSDILTASVNSGKFTSCFGTDGEYSLSPAGYLNNQNVLIAYYVRDGETIEVAGHAIDDKSWRMFVFLGEGAHGFGRQYPRSAPSVEELLVKLIDTRVKDYVERHDIELFYSTRFYCDGVNRTFTSQIDMNDDNIRIDNSEREVSPTDGVEIYEDANTLQSRNEFKGCACEICDDWVSESEATLMMEHDWGDDIYCCDNCLDHSENVRFHHSDGYYYDTDPHQVLEEGKNYFGDMGRMSDNFRPAFRLVDTDADSCYGNGTYYVMPGQSLHVAMEILGNRRFIISREEYYEFNQC